MKTNINMNRVLRHGADIVCVGLSILIEGEILTTVGDNCSASLLVCLLHLLHLLRLLA